MQIFFYLYSEFFWIILGIVMILLEMAWVAGIGFLFIGLGALTTVFFLEFQIITPDFLFELVVFLTASIVWWGILWYPMKLLKRDKASYGDLVGSVVILSDDIKKDHIGSIIWSGVRIYASLDKKEKLSFLKKGTKVKITYIKGNILYLMKED